MRARISTASGTSVELEGSQGGIAHVVVATSHGPIHPWRMRRGPGRPSQNAAANDLDNGRRRPSKPQSPELRKQMGIQGRYLGTIRKIGPHDKANVQALAKEKGVAVGLKLAMNLVERRA